MKNFFILWSTQSLSQLGSSMTAFALTLWLYQKTGSALQTSLLSICSYAPYVLMSIFAGALSDRWNKKKVMLVCDTLAACTSVAVLVMLRAGVLCPVHLYVLNALNGLMNTVQRPASDVAMTLIIPKNDYQRTSALRSLSQSVVTIAHPVLATAIFAAAGMDGVIMVDLLTFAVAFVALLLFVHLPELPAGENGARRETLSESVSEGLRYLGRTPMILHLILFLAGVNFVASAFNATLPALILPRANGGERVLGLITSSAGIATLAGSLLMTFLPKPKDRVRVIVGTMLFSLATENFLMAFSQSPVLWCVGQFLGWAVVPVMGANLDVVMRLTVPVEMQGRVYSCRNTLQFFTIPVGYFLGGLLIDGVLEPMMAQAADVRILTLLFGSGKGSGAGVMMFLLGVTGTAICIVSARLLRKYTFTETAMA